MTPARRPRLMPPRVERTIFLLLAGPAFVVGLAAAVLTPALLVLMIARGVAHGRPATVVMAALVGALWLLVVAAGLRKALATRRVRTPRPPAGPPR